MDTVLLLAILALAASGGGDEYVTPEPVADAVYAEPQTTKDQWSAMRQHPELTDQSGMQKPYSPLPWAGFFKKRPSKERVTKTKDAEEADIKGGQVGSSEVERSEEAVNTQKNTTSALKRESSDDAAIKLRKKNKERGDSGG